MRDPRHPRHFTDEFKRQIVDPYNAGKPKREIMDEYDLGKSTVERWVKSINATGSQRASDNRTPEQNRILELERENRRLRMEVDVLLHALAARPARRAGPCNRGIVGHSAGPGKAARPVKSAFATLSFLISDIEVFPADRGSEFDNAEIGLTLEVFGIERSLSAKDRSCDSAVVESANKILKAELVHRETFGTTREFRAKFSGYVHRYDNFRIHSTLGHMSPVEFKKAGLSLPESSK